MTTMPDPKTDTVACLSTLAAQYGEEWVFQLIGAVRTHHRADADPVGAYRVRLARDMVAEEMRRTGADEKTAIREVGTRLGYEYRTARTEGDTLVNTMANFRKLARGITRDMKIIGSGDQ